MIRSRIRRLRLRADCIRAWPRRRLRLLFTQTTTRGRAAVTAIRGSDPRVYRSSARRVLLPAGGLGRRQLANRRGRNSKDCRSHHQSVTPSMPVFLLATLHSSLSSRKALLLLTTRRHPNSAKMTTLISLSTVSPSTHLPASHPPHHKHHHLIAE
jgi:hypothetical protein